MAITSVFGWPFQATTDRPDGPNLGEDLALAIEATVQQLQTRLAVLENGLRLVNSLAERAALSVPVGTVIFRTDLGWMQIWDGSGWRSVGARATGSVVATSQTTVSAAYVDLATVGPQVSMETDTVAKVEFAHQGGAGAGGWAFASVAISGATTLAASDAWASYIAPSAFDGSPARSHLFTGLTPGVNVFTMKYKLVAAGTASFHDRELIVTPM